MGRLELAGVDHAEAPAGLRREGGDEVAGLGHPVHERTVTGRCTVGEMTPSPTPAQNRQAAFDENGDPGLLRDYLRGEVPATDDAVHALARAVLAIQKHLVEHEAAGH